MKSKKITSRQLKNKILELLHHENTEKTIVHLRRWPARKVVNPLFLLLCSMDEAIKWKAVTAMGAVVCELAQQDLESARVIMRRCMWNLNDESGGIGWGCPEAMAEMMACHRQLAEEYGCILLSYIRPDGNFLEHEVLQRGVLWGVGRLAYQRPDLLKGSAPLLYPFIQSADAKLRGLAVWAVGPLVEAGTMLLLESLADDTSGLRIYRNGQLVPVSIGQLAREALAAFCAR